MLRSLIPEPDAPQTHPPKHTALKTNQPLPSAERTAYRPIRRSIPPRRRISRYPPQSVPPTDPSAEAYRPEDESAAALRRSYPLQTHPPKHTVLKTNQPLPSAERTAYRPIRRSIPPALFTYVKKRCPSGWRIRTINGSHPLMLTTC